MSYDLGWKAAINNESRSWATLHGGDDGTRGWDAYWDTHGMTNDDDTPAPEPKRSGYLPGVDAPALNDWIICRNGGSWDRPHAWEIGQIQAVKDVNGVNRTMIFDTGEGCDMAPGVRYVVPEQIVAVFSSRAEAEAARHAAYLMRRLMAPIENEARASLDRIRSAISGAVVTAAQDMKVDVR